MKDERMANVDNNFAPRDSVWRTLYTEIQHMYERSGGDEIRRELLFLLSEIVNLSDVPLEHIDGFIRLFEGWLKNRPDILSGYEWKINSTIKSLETQKKLKEVKPL